jgi:hypothetical protein
MRLSTNGKAMAMLSMLPVFMSITLVPAVIPLFSGGTEDIMAFMLGEAKSPEPPPIRAINTARIQYAVVLTTVLKPANPIADTNRPAVARPLEPYLSDR